MALPRARLASASAAAGILMALAAFAMFSFMDTVVKLLGTRYHVAQVIFVNCSFGLLAVVLIGLARGGWYRLRPRQWRLHLARWVVSLVTTTAVFWSLPRLPLADLYAILFASPLLVIALSAPLLGEGVDWRRWTAVVAGFIGVLVILKPSGEVVAWPALVAACGAVGHALNMLIMRKIGTGAEPVEVIGVVGNLLTAVATGLVLPLVWITPSPEDFLLAAAAGTIAGGAFLLLAAAFRAAPAAIIAPFQYSQMLYAVVVGWLLFADLPSLRMLAGAGIIVISGLYVLRRV